MGKTPDRFPGTREEEEIQLIPGADSPTADGMFAYKAGVGFEFLEEGALKTLAGSGLTEPSHRVVDQLVHNLAEDSFTEYIYSGNQITNEIVWADATKVTKIRESTFTYTGNKITQAVTVQYDGAGAPVETLTEVFTYTGNKITSVDTTRT